MKKMYLFACVGGVLVSCAKSEQLGPDFNETSVAKRILIEEAFPARPAEMVTLSNGITICKVDSLYVFEGDILLSEEQVVALGGSSTRSAIINDFARYWPNGAVYYVYEPGFSNIENVEKAIDEWESKTSIRFYPRTNQQNYILFKNSPDTNSSSLGMVGKQQIIYLSVNGSTFGTAIHEIGHAIGLFHEQTRIDRDDYVTILWNNIESKKSTNFKKYNVDYHGYDIGPFDFYSVMLYDSWAFTANGNYTMVKKDGSSFYAQRSYLSAGDVDGVRFIYGPPYASVERTLIFSQEDWYGNYEYHWTNDLIFYEDKGCKQRIATLNSPRLVKIRSSYYENNRDSPFPNTTDSYYSVFVQAGFPSYYLGITREVFETDYGNIIRNTFESYGVAF